MKTSSFYFRGCTAPAFIDPDSQVFSGALLRIQRRPSLSVRRRCRASPDRDGLLFCRAFLPHSDKESPWILFSSAGKPHPKVNLHQATAVAGRQLVSIDRRLRRISFVIFETCRD